MSDKDTSRHFVFPRWANMLLPAVAAAVVIGPLYLGALLGFGANPTTLNVGYQPLQPVKFSHEMHAGQLGVDCRYCHTTVESAPFAAIPPTQTCMNCHNAIRPEENKLPNLLPVLESAQTGMPIEWVKVHDLPDYVYFNHSAHLHAGVSCVECHGRIDRMGASGTADPIPGVYQAKPLSMGWCLECHRDPSAKIRPTGRITDLGWTADQATTAEREEMDRLRRQIKSPRQLTDCSTCHR